MKKLTQKYQQTARIFKYHSIRRSRLFLALILNIALLFSSCVTHRNLEYLNVKNIEEEEVQTYMDARIPDYQLKPKDELFIQIKSLDDATTNIFEQLGTQQNNNMDMNITPYGASLMSYEIDKSGFIQLPVIGNIKVENKTVPEVISILQDSLNHILSKPTVTIKLVNRYVSVLGEVQRPGHFSYSQEKLTIFDAISLAGDVTAYGDRNDVILGRHENGKNLRIKIDLTSSNLMASEYYYIRPNDLVYVKPMGRKFWGLREFPWQILLSSISTGVLLYTVFGQ